MGIKRNILRHSAIYSFASLLGKLAGFFMLPFYAYIFETEGYGILALIDASIGFLAVAFSTGSSNAILRIYHEEPELRKPLVIGTGIWTVWGLSLVCTPLPALTSPWISAFLLGDTTHWPLIVLALIIFVVQMGNLSASTFLVIRQRSVLYSFVNLLELITSIALNIILVIYLQIGLVGVFLASLITSLLASVIFHWAAIREYGLSYDAEIGRKLRAFWFPLIPGDLFAYVARQAERYLVRFLVSLEGVGILEMAYKFAPILNIFIGIPFMRAWQTKSLEIGPNPDGPKEIASMFTIYLFLLLFGAVFLSGNVGSILRILTPPEFWPGESIARVEVITTVIHLMCSFLIFGLLYSKQTGKITYIRIVSSVGKIVFSIIFIWTMGLTGAAYSALATEIVVLTWIFSSAQRVYRLQLEYRKIAVLCVSWVLLVALIDHVPQFAGGILTQVKELLADNIVDCLANTWLGEWRSGRIIRILDHRTAEFARLIVSSSLCLLYGIVIFIIKPEWTRKAIRR